MFIKMINKHRFIDSIVNNVDSFHINIVINSVDKTKVMTSCHLICGLRLTKMLVAITDFKNGHRDFYRNV